MKWEEMQNKGFKIIRWYEVKGADFQHLVCFQNMKTGELLVEYWKGGETSKYEEFSLDEAYLANDFVKKMLQTAELFKVRTREEVLRTISLLESIDSSFVA